MTNIFDGLEKLNDDVIMDNIAMLEAVNMGNVFKGYGSKASNTSAKMLNGIGKLFGKESMVHVEKEKTMEDYIGEEKEKIRDFSRMELDDKLLMTLRGKSDLKTMGSKDAISAYCINSVAKNLKIDKDLTVAQKADAIHSRYLEKLLASMQKELVKQDKDSANKTIVALEKNIESLNQDEKQKLMDILNIKSLTGNEIRAVLMKAGTPALIMGALSASGFGAFIALNTIIHAVFTTILGVTIPFAFYTGASSALSFMLGPAGIAMVAGTTVWQFTKGNKKIRNELVSQLIFLSVNAYGRSFSARDDELPSFEADELRLDGIKKRDREYTILVEDNNLLQKEVQSLTKEHSKLLKNIDDYEQIIARENWKKQESKLLIHRLQWDKEQLEKEHQLRTDEFLAIEKELKFSREDELEEQLQKRKDLYLKYQDETENLSRAINYQKDLYELASKEIEENEFKLLDSTAKNIGLENENERLKKELAKKDQEISYREEIRKREIEQKWIIYYKDFLISHRAIKKAAHFSKIELWKIEKALNELHSLNDYSSVSRGKVVENGIKYDHMGFPLPGGPPGRIQYRTLSNANKKVEIEDIYRHSEKKFQ
ncbi:MAG: hypothetical protein GX829_06215 [Clostridium sp.]|nr:hypothetical protein [Clostridium sp.]